ncbi:MAG: MFS transporter [Caldilineaceae bacterium]|nr:MFS transporter [Caldilineaceae bacterium]
MTTQSTTYTRSFWTTWSAALLFFAGFYAIIVPLPLYLEEIGLPDWQIGLIMGAFGIASLVGRPLAGALTDSVGFRPVILFGTAGLALGAVGVGFVTWPPLLFGLRILQAAGYVAFTTAATSLISDLAPAARRGAAIALFGIAANAAITLVPAAISAGLTLLTLRGAFLLCGALAILGGALVWFTVPAREDVRRPFVMRSILNFPAVLHAPMLTTWLFGIGFGVFYQFLPLLAERRGLAPVGLAYTVYGLSIIGTRLLTGRLMDRPDRRQVLPPAALLMAAGLSTFAIADQLWMLLAAAALTAVGGGLFHPALIAIHVDSIPERGRATAAFYLAFDLGIGLGAWILAPVLDSFGLTLFFLAGAVISLIAILPTRAIWVAKPSGSQA